MKDEEKNFLLLLSFNEKSGFWKKRQKSLMYQGFLGLEFYGRLNLFLFFFHKAFFKFHKKSIKKPYISSIYGQWFLLEVSSPSIRHFLSFIKNVFFLLIYQYFLESAEIALFLNIFFLLPLTKNQVFGKSVIKPLIYQELGGLRFLGLNPNTQKLFFVLILLLILP